jgi:hypothetical protein
MHAALIERSLGGRIVGVIARDATEIEAREKPVKPEPNDKKILCGWTAARLGRLSFHTSMEATDAVCHLRDRCRDHRPRE